MDYKKNGFVITERYSETMEDDTIGRWARVVYYNGIQIAWIEKAYGKSGDKTVIKFISKLHFPTLANDLALEHKFHDTLELSIEWTKERFNWFKNHISDE